MASTRIEEGGDGAIYHLHALWRKRQARLASVRRSKSCLSRAYATSRINQQKKKNENVAVKKKKYIISIVR